jgi:predicted nucleotidyltransferase
MTVSFLNDTLPSALANFPEIKLVYLFGSQVTGQIGPMSDYDLAISYESQEDSLSIQSRFQYEMSKLLQTDRVDVVLLNRAPIDLAFNIISGGVLLFQKDLYTRVEFEARILGQHGDYLPTLHYFNQRALEGDMYGKRVERYREALKRIERTLGPARTSAKPSSH